MILLKIAIVLPNLRCVNTNQFERHIELWQQSVGVRGHTLVRLVTEEIDNGGVFSNSHRQDIAHDSLWIAWPGIDLKGMGDMVVILKSSISKYILRIKCMSRNVVKLFFGEFHRSPLMISQHWFWYWLGAIRQQTIIWASVDPDPYRHMEPLGHDE